MQLAELRRGRLGRKWIQIQEASASGSSWIKTLWVQVRQLRSCLPPASEHSVSITELQFLHMQTEDQNPTRPWETKPTTPLLPNLER